MATSQKDLRDLLEHGLKDIYYAEHAIHKALPNMIDGSADADLKEGLTKHREETAGHIKDLDKVFEIMGVKAEAEKCDAIDGILKEGDKLLKDFGGTPSGDAAIIFACQAVEHYEIARYGSLRAFAELLDMDDVAELLNGILEEEYNADETLSDLAEDHINGDAAEASRKA